MDVKEAFKAAHKRRRGPTPHPSSAPITFEVDSTEKEVFSSLCIESGSASGTDHGEEKRKQIEKWLFVKLLLALPKQVIDTVAALNDCSIQMPLVYELLQEHSNFAEIKNAVGTVNGALVGNLRAYFNWMLGYYRDLHLWRFHEGAQHLLVPLFFDNRSIWGKNELFAWGPRHVLHTQSPSNMWPLAMWKFKGKETYNRIRYLDNFMGITTSRQGLHNSVCSLTFSQFTPNFWHSLMTVPPASYRRRT